LLKDNFAKLIKSMHDKTGKKLVILIDEYDKPIIDNINDYNIADGNRKVLNNFYGVLKSSEEFIQFIFLTGVTKFSKTSIFSGLNNITDITLTYPCICGYTQEELEYYFKEYINKFSEDNNISNSDLLSLIREWYNVILGMVKIGYIILILYCHYFSRVSLTIIGLKVEHLLF
jgi:hypothetical protein